ncbi:MAG: NADH:flavin oxidoreductase/NADH oxidase [Alphaproteobacteria bacterium]
MPGLFDPLSLRDVTFPNRIGLSPMCQYSARDGFIGDWHLMHLGARAQGGAGLIIVEATAVRPEGRITYADTGIWSDDHIPQWRRVAEMIRSFGAVPAIQLAHAGVKASSSRPWADGRPKGDAAGYSLPDDDAEGWPTVAASALAFGEITKLPRAVTPDEIADITSAFGQAARRAREAGFDVIEIHGAHGYLLHGFYSPLTNRRRDAYGGSFENRTRILRETVSAIRGEWPEGKPLFLRLSTADGFAEGWQVADSARVARDLRPLGLDLVDCSSGGAAPGGSLVYAPGFQVPLAAEVRRTGDIATAAVGAISDARMADAIVAEAKADLVLFGRKLLEDPYWPRRAAVELGREAGLPARPIQYDWWL